MTIQTLIQNQSFVKTPGGRILFCEGTLATVTYDRRAKQYIVANGRELGRFPSGKENKIQAEWLALAHDAGELCETARQMVESGTYPDGRHASDDEGRLLRAARVIIEGRVLENYRDGNYTRALVKASEGNRSPLTGQDLYHVYHNIIWTCDCQDWEGRRSGGERGHFCKHILALQMLERLEEQRQDEAALAVRRKLEGWQDRGVQYCDICWKRPAVTLDGLCEPCQNGVDEADLVLDLELAPITCPQCQGHRTYGSYINQWTGTVHPAKCLICDGTGLAQVCWNCKENLVLSPSNGLEVTQGHYCAGCGARQN